jgi:hypothetical protein
MNTLSGQRSYDTVLTLDGLSQFDSSIQTQALLIDGSNAMVADLDAGGHVVKNLSSGVNASDSATFGQVTALETLSDSKYLAKTGGTLTATTGTTRLGIASNTQGLIEFNNVAGTSLAQMFYAQANSDLRFSLGTNTNVFRISGTQITSARNLSMGITNRIVNLSPGISANDGISYTQAMLRSGVNAATADIPMGGFKLTGVGLATVGTDAASKDYVDSVATTLTTAYTLADSNLATSVDTTYYKKSGGLVSGTISSTGITQPFNFSNSAGPLVSRMSAGQVSVTNSCTLEMCSNSASIINFQDNTNTTKAKIQYSFGTPGAISLVVGGSQVLSASDTTLACGLINMQQNRIFNLAPTPTTDQDAVPRLYMQNADSVVASNATAALTVEVNARVASVGAEAATRAAQDAALLASSVQKAGDTMTGSLTFSGGNINMGTGYIGLQNGVSATDAVNKQQMEAGDATVASNASSALTTGLALKLDKTGTSPLTMTGVQNSLNITNTGGTLNTNFTAGTAAAPQSYYQIMTSNVQSLFDFRGNDGVQRAFFRYLYGSPGALELSVNNTLLLSVAPSAINMYQTLNMNSLQITGLAAGTGAGNAVRYDQTVLRTGVNAMQGSLSFGTTNKITNLAAGTSGTSDAANCTQALMRDGTLPMLGSVDWNGYAINNLGPGTSPLGAVNYNQIAFSLIPISVHRVGDTTERQCLAGTLGHGLVTSSFGPGSNAILVTTQMQCNSGNQVHVRGQFEINSSGGANDSFHVVVRLSATEFVQFNEVFPTETGYRTRNYTWDTAWTIASSFLRTITIRLYNDSGTDTTTVNAANFKYTLEQFQG